MKTFAGQQIEPLFQFSWLVVFLTLLLCGGLGLLFAFTVDPNLGIAVSLSFLAVLYIFFSKSLPFIFFQKCRECQNSLFYLELYLHLSSKVYKWFSYFGEKIDFFLFCELA